MASNRPASYSVTQILIHWIVAFLVISQLVFSEGMEDAYHAFTKGKELSTADVISANTHVIIGFAILALAAIRLIIRAVRGVPGAPEGQSGPKVWIATATQAFLYLVIFVMPITGALAWFGGYVTMAEIHAYAKPLIVLAVLVHLGGALMQHYVAKTDVLVRMMRAEKKRVA